MATVRKSNSRRAITAPPEIDTDRSITERLPDLVESLIRLAVGVLVEKKAENGGPVYLQPPNRLAAEYLINRVLGKPAERAQAAGSESFDEIERQLKDLRNLTTDELIQLHRKTIGEG